MLRNFEYRIYPSRKQLDKLYSTFRLCAEAYNLMLAEHEAVYELDGRTLSRNELNIFLTDLKRRDQRFKAVHSQVLQNQANRLSKAFANFFRRCKIKAEGSNINVGYPRYKKLTHNICYPQNNGAFKLVGHKLVVSKLGDLPIVLHRPPLGTTKTVTIKRNRAGQFFAVFCCEAVVLDIPMHVVGPLVAFDQGLSHLLVGTDGTIIDPPKYLRQAEKRLKKRQRRLSKKVKGSNNRKKAMRRLAKLHLHVANQRQDFLHQLSREVAEKYSIIVVEDLQLSNMVNNHHLAKSFNDAGLGTLIQMLDYKVSETGSQLIVVPAAYTTQTCSRCGHVKEGDGKLGLKDRTYRCSHCGLVIDRDLNAAYNILARAGLARSHACGDNVRPSQEEAVVVEAGTIRFEIEAGSPRMNSWEDVTCRTCAGEAGRSVSPAGSRSS